MLTCVNRFRSRTPTRHPPPRRPLRLWCPARAVLTLRVLLLAALLLLGLRLIWPEPTVAAATCSTALPFTNVAACVDGIQYNLWRMLTSTAWIVPRLLLSATFYVGQVRGLLVEVVFSGVYDALGDLVDEVLIALVTLALVFWGVFQLALPIIGRQFLNLKHILTWAILVPLLVAVLGPAFAGLDGIRVSLGGAFFTTAFDEATASFTSISTGTPLTPAPLYPDSSCGGTLDRPPGVVAGTILLDDLAATMLYADAQDIHCPEHNETLSPPRPSDLPRGFYASTPGFTYVAVSTPDDVDNLGEVADPGERARALTNIRDGLNHVLVGTIPASLALVEAIIQLFLSLALMVIWLSFPVIGLFIVFHRDAGPILVLLQRSAKVIQVTLVISLLLGVLTAVLIVVASTSGALAFASMALVSYVIVAYLALTAFSVLWESIVAFTDSVRTGMGADASAALGLVGGAVTAGSAVVTGGATLAGAGLGAAATGMTAARTSGSAVSGVAAGIGTIRPLMKVGEVAAGMGLAGQHTDELFTGLAAGERARRRGIGAMQREMRRDQEWAAERDERREPRAAASEPRAAEREEPAAPLRPERPRRAAAVPEQTTEQVGRNWEDLRASIGPPVTPVTGPTTPLAWPVGAPETPAAAPAPAAGARVSPSDLTEAVRVGMRDLVWELTTTGHRTDQAAEATDEQSELAWEREANHDRDAQRAAQQQEALLEQAASQRLAQELQGLGGVIREQTAQDALTAAQAATSAAAAGAAAAGGGTGSGDGSGDGSGGGGGQAGQQEAAGAEIARTLESGRAANAPPSRGRGDDPSRDQPPQADAGTRLRQQMADSPPPEPQPAPSPPAPSPPAQQSQPTQSQPAQPHPAQPPQPAQSQPAQPQQSQPAQQPQPAQQSQPAQSQPAQQSQPAPSPPAPSQPAQQSQPAQPQPAPPPRAARAAVATRAVTARAIGIGSQTRSPTTAAAAPTAGGSRRPDP